MIGVVAKADQRAAVEEFFQLFKTPWEFHRPGRTYDVVVATADEIPAIEARLLVVYGAALTSRDGRAGVGARALHRGASLAYRGAPLPIYGEVLTFETGGHKTRAEVTYVSAPTGGGDSQLRLGLRFLDAPLPDALIPPNAKPLPDPGVATRQTTSLAALPSRAAAPVPDGDWRSGS